MSYSTPTRLSARIGPRIYAGLTAEGGNVPDDAVAQGILDAAAAEVNIKIGTRYIWPVTIPPRLVGLLAGLEEQIAHWFLYVYRGIGTQETAASAAKVGYDAAMATLLAISKAEIDLDGAILRDDTTDIGGGFVLGGEISRFNPDDDPTFPGLGEWPYY